MITSQDGIDIIKQFEGFKSKAYYCPAGKLTIGYGHVILPYENDLKSAVITEEQAENILRADIQIAEATLNGTKLMLEQNQFDALVSFIYNVGPGAFLNSTLIKRLRVGDYPGAAHQFLRWTKANGVELSGLVRRRKAEKELFEREC